MTIVNGRVEPFLGCGIGGILKGVFGIEGGMAIIHGPMSCASGHRIVPLFADKEPLLPSTAITEIEAVMGTADILRRAIEQACERYHPSLLAVVLTCATSLTGEMYETILSGAQKKYGIPVFLLDGSGITGDELSGYLHFHQAFRSRLPETSGQKSPGVELAGLSSADYIVKQDLATLQYLLLDAFGVQVKRVLFHKLEFSLEKWENLTYIPAGRLWMETPQHCPAPYGAGGTLDWLEMAAHCLDQPIFETLRIQAREARELIRQANENKIGAGLRVGIEGESWWAVGLARCLQQEMGCQVIFSSDRNAIRFQEEFGEIGTTLVDTGNVELTDAFKEFGVDLVFGSSYVKKDPWAWVPYWQPIYHVVPDPESLMGFAGIPILLREINQVRIAKDAKMLAK
jgi:nitrogenase molybdenum-iron protein alpha/beta subunit